jgi:hypothetical protein
MTDPPQSSDESGRADERTDTGASPVDRDRFATQPTPVYGQAAPQYGQPQPPQPQNSGQYGWPAQPAYGQPQQPYGGPHYGAAQNGPPAGAPGGTSKVGLIALVAGLALLLIAGVVVLVMSLQSTVLDPAAVQRDVAAQFEQREGVAVELNCPDDMKVKANATYDCSGTTADGESVTLQIAIADENTAAYTWTEP